MGVEAGSEICGESGNRPERYKKARSGLSEAERTGEEEWDLGNRKAEASNNTSITITTTFDSDFCALCFCVAQEPDSRGLNGLNKIPLREDYSIVKGKQA